MKIITIYYLCQESSENLYTCAINTKYNKEKQTLTWKGTYIQMEEKEKHHRRHSSTFCQGYMTHYMSSSNVVTATSFLLLLLLFLNEVKQKCIAKSQVRLCSQWLTFTLRYFLLRLYSYIWLKNRKRGKWWQVTSYICRSYKNAINFDYS